jgi:hypothetical protein
MRTMQAQCAKAAARTEVIFFKKTFQKAQISA